MADLSGIGRTENDPVSTLRFQALPVLLWRVPLAGWPRKAAGAPRPAEAKRSCASGYTASARGLKRIFAEVRASPRDGAPPTRRKRGPEAHRFHGGADYFIASRTTVVAGALWARASTIVTVQAPRVTRRRSRIMIVGGGQGEGGGAARGGA